MIFTFGYGQRLRATNAEGRAWHPNDIQLDDALGGWTPIGFRLDDRYVAIDADPVTARAVMLAIFGRVWSMEYNLGPAADTMIAEYRLRELDIKEPLGEIARDRDHPLRADVLRLLGGPL